MSLISRPVIGINALYLKPGRVGGTERYLRELVPWLVTMRPHWTWKLFVCRNATSSVNTIHPDLQLISIPGSSEYRSLRVLGEQLLFPSKADQLDAILNLGSSALALTHTPQVTMIHDVQHKAFPEFFGIAERWAIETVTRIAIKHSRMVLVPSDRIRTELMAAYPILENRIQITPLAASEAFVTVRSRSPDECPESLRRVLPEKYVLSPAAFRPNKNLPALCDAFLASRSMRSHELVLIGASGSDAHELHAHELIRSNRARVLGWLSDEEVPWAFRLSDAILLGTRYEGFCLPVLEAFASGTPVIASEIEPISSIAGNAAILVPTDNIGALSMAIDSVLENPALRKRLVSKGVERAKNFSWNRTAELTALAIEQVLG